MGLVPRTCRSELIYFRKGGEAQLPATIEGNRVVLAMPDGKIELARDEIRKIVPGFWPATEWDTRRQTARAGIVRRTIGGRVVGHRERPDHGSRRRNCASSTALDPKHLPTARMAAVLDRLDQPVLDPDFGRFQKALGIETRVARGPHVILLHQHSDAEADERIALLERVITGYLSAVRWHRGSS